MSLLKIFFELLKYSITLGCVAAVYQVENSCGSIKTMWMRNGLQDGFFASSSAYLGWVYVCEEKRTRPLHRPFLFTPTETIATLTKKLLIVQLTLK